MKQLISIQHLFLFIPCPKAFRRTFSPNFNTTLVFIYPLPYRVTPSYDAFQYNTCFYLSDPLLEGYGWELKFQYNTCFYLSTGQAIATAIVALFQYNTCFYLSGCEEGSCGTPKKFQYNTCFYLSAVVPVIPKSP